MTQRMARIRNVNEIQINWLTNLHNGQAETKLAEGTTNSAQKQAKHIINH